MGAPVARGKNNQLPRAFPPLTPQSYLPGSVGAGYPGVYPGTGPNQFPPLSPNSFMPPGGPLEPPIMNLSGGPGLLPAPMSYPSMIPSVMPPPGGFPPPMPIGPPPSLPPPPPMYGPEYPFYSRRRPTRICRPRRSRRCRPVIHIVDSDSCSTVSSYRSLSPCHRRRRRSRSCSRRRACTPQPQQQPIIVLPVQCQQPSPGLAAPSVTNAQPQQIILPPIQVQQSGQYPSQQLALPPISLQALGGQQQQQLALPPIQINSSGLAPNGNGNPVIISAGGGGGGGGLPSFIQPSSSLPQVTSIAQGQPMQAGRIQYVQAMPQTSSPLQYVTAGRSNAVAPTRVLVNSTNKKPSVTKKPLERSLSSRQVAQMDLKYGRRPFDWYKNSGRDSVINENVQVGPR